MSKQTAVEWLAEKYELVGILTTPMVERAKAIEREQIIDAVEAGYQIANEDERFKHIQTHGQYYNETYKGGEQ